MLIRRRPRRAFGKRGNAPPARNVVRKVEVPVISDCLLPMLLSRHCR